MPRSMRCTYTWLRGSANSYPAVQDGDSGSWVIDPVTLEVFGHVVAADILGDAYVVPICDTFSDITTALGLKSVTLPGCEDVLRASAQIGPDMNDISPSPTNEPPNRNGERQPERQVHTTECLPRPATAAPSKWDELVLPGPLSNVGHSARSQHSTGSSLSRDSPFFDLEAPPESSQGRVALTSAVDDSVQFPHPHMTGSISGFSIPASSVAMPNSEQHSKYPPPFSNRPRNRQSPSAREFDSERDAPLDLGFATDGPTKQPSIWKRIPGKAVYLAVLALAGAIGTSVELMVVLQRPASSLLSNQTIIDWVEDMRRYRNTTYFDRDTCFTYTTTLLNNGSIPSEAYSVVFAVDQANQPIKGKDNMTLSMLGCENLCGPQTYYVVSGPRFMTWILPSK